MLQTSCYSEKNSGELFQRLSSSFHVRPKIIDPYVVLTQMTEALNKIKIFQLRFGVYKLIISRCDIHVTNVFDDDSKQYSVTQLEQFEIGLLTASTTISAGYSTMIQLGKLIPITPLTQHPTIPTPTKHRFRRN